jgi:CxxC motif-containing protein (DUF1111 family)
MSAFRFRLVQAAGLALLLCGWLPHSAAEEASDHDGYWLFVRRFEVGKGLTTSSDGLGPVYNHHSCVACHHQGGAGGGGPLDVNVQMLSARLVAPPTAVKSRRGLSELRSLHPGFVSSQNEFTPHIVLHRFGTDERYGKFRARLTSLEVPLKATASDRRRLAMRLNAAPVENVNLSENFRLEMVQRNTPALFGAGLIDQIPDSVLHKQAELQHAAGRVSGRVPPVDVERVGRFGWRGQTERLRDFVLGACANELGLDVPGHGQPRDPLQPNRRTARLDLTSEHCGVLTDFVADLAQPRLVWPDTLAARDRVTRGQAFFDAIGCAECHVRKLGSVEEIYSDLLLHDMGLELADPIAAEPKFDFIRSEPIPPEQFIPPQRPHSSYAGSRSFDLARSMPGPPLSDPFGSPESSPTDEVLGGPTPKAPAAVSIVDAKARVRKDFLPDFTDADREWRTPPLWGVADSAPYLHDGRAATLNEAISLHGGEALESKQRFFELADDDRRALVDFLMCLRAPE